MPVSYRMPRPNDWFSTFEGKVQKQDYASLTDVLFSKRSYDDCCWLREQYHKLKASGKTCNWPPLDDPLVDRRAGWYLEGMPVTEHFPEYYYCRTLSVYLQERPLINDCLAYMYYCWVQKWGEDAMEAVPGETGSYRYRRMAPEQSQWNELNKCLVRVMQEALVERPLVVGSPLFGDYSSDGILRVFNHDLPWINKWCLASYINNPELWTVGTGKYSAGGIFKKTTVVTIPQVKIDTMAILAASKDVDVLAPPRKKKKKKRVVVREYKYEPGPARYGEDEDLRRRDAAR